MYERLERLLNFNLSIYRHYSLRPVSYAHTFPEDTLLLIEFNLSLSVCLFSSKVRDGNERYIVRFQSSLNL